ncbi:NAD-dependent histone deacetylase sir2 [Chytriomyces hyalinus]|nr:NAD-dependent histone deacetylase sir2 [Chytriomyces hyalinus]
MRDSQKYPQSKAKRLKRETLPQTSDAPNEEGSSQVPQSADSTKGEGGSFDAAVDLFRKSRRIIVVTGKLAMRVGSLRLTSPLGAGISTNAGIPDFRSENGIYSRLDEFKLDSPEDIFHIDFFKCNPQPFYTFSKNLIADTSWKPTLCHEFVKLLEVKKKLLRNYTQNIDGLEKRAGVNRVLQVHGSFSTGRCTACKYKAAFEIIKPFLETGNIMHCPKCFERKEGIVKPDIVFFGEKYSSTYDKLIAKDKAQADLIVVMGSSLKIFPIAGILDQMSEVPAILINKETLDAKVKFDYMMKGDSDTIVSEICRRLGWDLVSPLLPPSLIKERDGGLVEFFCLKTELHVQNI